MDLFFTFTWGLFFGIYTGYKPNIKLSSYLNNVTKYMGKTFVKLTPMCAVARATNYYLE